jgi:hypothetical protein
MKKKLILSFFLLLLISGSIIHAQDKKSITINDSIDKKIEIDRDLKNFLLFLQEYDFETDPCELINIYDKPGFEVITAEMKKIMKKHRKNGDGKK